MKNIKFEGLGLSLDINDTLFEINGTKIYMYGFCIILGIVISLILCKKDDGKYNIKFQEILDLAVFVLPVSIISARLYYVVFNLNYYAQNLKEIFNIRNGGLAVYGGIIGAIITIIVFCKIKRIKVLDMLDYLAPYLALGQAIGRWGNFFNQEAHGIETQSILRMGLIENGKYIQVHPTFLYESICTFTIFVFLYKISKKRKYGGQIAYLYFFLYGIVRAAIEGLRTDSLMIGNFRVSQLISIGMATIFGCILLYKSFYQKKGLTIK